MKPALLFQMMRIRAVEERIAARYAEQEMRCPTHLAIGQESAPAAVCAALEPRDRVLSHHRSHGHYLAKGGDLDRMIAELYGRATGCSGGRGGSMHLVDEAAGFLGAVPIVGSPIPIAVGAALGARMRGDDRVVAVFLGDAAVEAGVTHEALSYASLEALPVLFVCENNLYSVQTGLAARQPARPIHSIAGAHRVRHACLHGEDVFALYEAAKGAVLRARRGEGPTFLEVETYRYLEHVGPLEDVDLGYRTREEIEAWRARDPIVFATRALALEEATLATWRAEITAEIDRAFDRARAAPMPSSSTLADGVFRGTRSPVDAPPSSGASSGEFLAKTQRRKEGSTIGAGSAPDSDSDSDSDSASDSVSDSDSASVSASDSVSDSDSASDSASGSDARSPSLGEGFGEGLPSAGDPLPPPLPKGGGPSPRSAGACEDGAVTGSDVRSPSLREGFGEGLRSAGDPLPPPLPKGGGPSPRSARASEDRAGSGTDVLPFHAAIRDALDLALAHDPRVFLIGLGVPDPKGLFGSTKGLVDTHGPTRVRDMPASENALTGVVLGAALAGMRPVLSHQRVDFALLSLEPLVNQAAKWHAMFGRAAPLVVRMIVGRGWGQGAQHSQSLASWFAHVPGLVVLAPATPADAKGLMLAAIERDDPVVVLEHRWLFDVEGEVPRGLHRTPIGVARVAREGRHVTIVASSFMVLEALRAAERLAADGVDAEVIDLRTLAPLDVDTIVRSVEKTGHLVATDIGWESYGASAEVIARVCERAFRALLRAPVRVASPDVPSPSSPALSAGFWPRARDLVDAVRAQRGLSALPPDPPPAHPLDVPDPRFRGPF